MEKPIVILKVGTSSLVNTKTGATQVSYLARVSEVVNVLMNDYRVIIVTSGAVGLGCSRLGLKERPTTIAGKQAAAAVGQLKLMSLFDDFFSILGRRVAQVLITYDTFGDRSQYINFRNAVMEMLKYGTVPIINENDTIAVQELRVGDNDTLSAHVAALVGASWLFLLTDVDSLYEANPSEVAGARPIRLVQPNEVASLRRQMQEGCKYLVPGLDVMESHEYAIRRDTHGLDVTTNVSSRTRSQSSGSTDSNHSISTSGDSKLSRSVRPNVAASVAIHGKAGSQWGTGGMLTKLKAAQLATAAGVSVVIMNTNSVEKIGIGLKRFRLGGSNFSSSVSASNSGIATSLVTDSTIQTGIRSSASSQNLRNEASRTKVNETEQSIHPAHPSLSSSAPSTPELPEVAAIPHLDSPTAIHSEMSGDQSSQVKNTSLSSQPNPVSTLNIAKFMCFVDDAIGTTFLPAVRPVTGRKKWILALNVEGSLILDDGAIRAVLDKRKSLFPAGVVAVEGKFTSQDAVSLKNREGVEVARALINYSFEECRKLLGRKSVDINEILGYSGPEALSDRDNIVKLREWVEVQDSELPN